MSEENRAATAAYADNDDNIMSDSANALTKKLYLTVMDVFGSYAANGNDDEYAKMIENLQKKQMKDTQTKASSPVKSDDNRGIIAMKLLEGWVLSGDYCEECAIPMMAYNGELSCVVCKKGGEIDDITKSLSESVLALQSEEAEGRVNKELSEFRERRTQSTQVYTSKLLSGYAMHDEQCSKCDMPMMKMNEKVECIFCPEEEKVTEIDVEEEEEEQVEDAPVEEASMAVKELSQSELLIKRLRGTKSKSSEENVESEIEKAEDELLKLLETLGLQGNENGETIEEFISKKKEARQKKIDKTSDVIVEAEVVSDLDGVKIDSEHGKDFKSGAPMKVMVDGVPAVAYRIAPPVTPKLDSSTNCRLGDSIFPSLKNLFASASPPIVDDMCTNPYVPVPNPHDTNSYRNVPVPNHRDTSRIEAKKRISMLVRLGWEVSAHECPQCSLPLFTSSQGQTLQIEGLMRCVMCGPIAQDAPKSSIHDNMRSSTREETQDELNLRMVNKVKEEMDQIKTMQNKLNALNKKLEVDVPASSEAILVLPDPTTSMYDHRNRVDPPVEDNLMLKLSQAVPTPKVTFAAEPTPNNARFNESSNLPTYEQLLAMYKQQGKLNAPQPMHAVDPTPSNTKFISNMKAMEAPVNK